MDANTVGIIIAVLVAAGGFLVFVGKSVRFFAKLEVSVDSAVQSLSNLSEAFGATGERLTQLEVVLIGLDGENGVRGDVKAIRGRVEVIEQRLGPEDRRFEVRPWSKGRREGDGE